MTKLFKNNKRILSCVLAFAVIAVSLFTGAVVSHIHADAAEPTVTAEGNVDLLEFGDYLIDDLGSTSKYWDTKLADNGETGADWANAIIIDSAEELVYLCKASGNDTIGKYYKVADGIAGFNLSTAALDLDGTLAENLDVIKGSGKNHAGGTPGFQGHFDGNGATVYGAWTNHEALSNYAGLFSCTFGEVTIKNIHVNKAHFTAKNAAGGIIGYHKAADMCTVTIENCSVTDSYLEVTGTGYGFGVGAILGYGASAPAKREANDQVDYNGDGDMADTIYINVDYQIKNCYVNIDEANFVSINEGGSAAGQQVCHGGIAGQLDSNALKVSDSVVIGITPYATSISTDNNAIQHSGLASHFANVYTTSDIAITDIAIGGTLPVQNFTDKVFPLIDAQLKGAAATANMNLDWSVWMADANGYPELANAHKNIILVDKEDGTHAATCACGFGGIAVEHNFAAGECACGALLNCATRKTITWDGSVATGIATGTGEKNNPYIIKTAAELAWLVQQKADVTTDKYYKIDDAIGAIVLQSADKAAAIMALDSAAATKAYFESGTFTAWKTMGWEGSCFAGHFDGNGVTIYGLYAPSVNNAALFSTVDGGSAIRNIAVKNSYFTSSGGNYQVGALIGTTSSVGYGAKRQGIVWVSDVVIANNYMYNNAVHPQNGTIEHSRSGIIGGVQEAIQVENCLVYGNDATYNDGFKMPLVSNLYNNIVLAATHYDGLEPKISVNEATGETLYYNVVRNTVVLGTDIMSTQTTKGWRKNEPDCFENCYTDGASGTVAFTDGEFTYEDAQIKAITEDDLATAELGDAWINTATYPELKSFHDEVFSGDAAPAGAAGHSASCSCGLAGSDLQEHEFDDLSDISNCACSVCGYVCEHVSETEGITEYEGDCVTAAGYEYDCPLCGYHEEDFAPVAGHNFTNHDAQAGADCQTEGTIAYKSCSVCNKNYAANAADTEPFENAITELSDGAKGECVVLTDEDDGSIVYGVDGNNHWTQCKVCEEPITTEAHSGDVTDNGDGTHSVTCTVCLYESDAEDHNFVSDDDPATWTSYYCDGCGYVCDHANGEEVNYEGDCVTAAGYEFDCPDCHYHEEDFAPVAGHNFTNHDAQAGADCQTEGTIAYKSCSVCNKNYAENASDTEPFENALTDLSDGVVGPCASTATEFEYDENGHFKLCDLCEARVEEAAHQGVNTPHGADGHAIECEICNFADDEAPHVFGDDNVCDTCNWECTEHNFVDGDVIDEGDCVTDRVVAQVCDICGTAGDDDVTAAPGHDFDEYEGYEGNCTYGGEIDHKYCAECGEYFAADEDDVYSEDYLDYETEVATPPVEGAHDWNDIEPSEATCEEPGNIAFKICLSCYLAQIGEDEVQVEIDFDALYAALEEIDPDNFESPEDYEAAVVAVAEEYIIAALDEAGVLIPAAHKLNEVKEEAATTEKAGTKAHYACANCDKLFADAEGKTEVTATSLVIEKLVAEDNKEDNKQEDDKAETPDGDNSSTSPVTGESAAAVAAVAALMGAAFVIIRKARKA